MNNPYYKIFPTREEHFDVLTKYYEKYGQAGFPDRFRLKDWKNRGYFNYLELYNDIRREFQLEYKYIIELYQEKGYIPSQTWQSEYFDEFDVTFANLTIFRAMDKLVYKEDSEGNIIEDPETESRFVEPITKLTPGNFHMANMITDPRYFSKIDTHMKTHGITRFHVEGEYLTDLVSPNIYTTMGWDFLSLNRALSEAGVFDTKVTPTDIVVKRKKVDWVYNETTHRREPVHSEVDVKLYQHEYPNLEKLGLPSKYLLENYIKGYDASNLRKPQLEYLYSLAFKPKLEWSEVCKDSVINADSISIEYKRLTGKNIPGDSKEAMCSYLLKRRNFEEIKELSQAILLQPGGVSYKKYMVQPELFISPGSSQVNKLFLEFDEICNNPNKDRFNALLYAVRLGIPESINDEMTKLDICKIIKSYLDKLEYKL